MPITQTDENKKGEVEFRRKLARQFSKKEIIFKHEPNTIEFKKILKDRITDYVKYFNKLRNLKIPITPFLEIGSGVGQAAMLLENKFNASGFTTDISFETLLL